ncbi:DUF3991 domain-containing protein [Anaerofustis sp. HA2171]|uniref:DUF3991 domain-containing protein n=1 Tax=Anaerofustis butyriciformans TaxID=3108533 RepID=UPI002E305CB2|nr:DUF3991 domain-containing protein [Anaerofustis sp. HA2171]
MNKSNIEIINDLKRNISIVDYARYLGFHVVKKGNKYYSLEEHDSVMIDVTSNTYRRFSVDGYKKDIINFVEEFEHLRTSEAIEKLKKFNNNTLNYSNKKRVDKHTQFNKWFDTFIQEKDNIKEFIILNKDDNIHMFSTEDLCKHIKKFSIEEKEKIKDTLVKLDYVNADIMDFFNYIAEKLYIENDKTITLPEKSSSYKNIFAYLNKTRNIDNDIINDAISNKLLFQDVNNNCCFVGYNEEGDVNYLIKRGTNTYKAFRAEDKNNDYQKGMLWQYTDNSDKLIITESPIDTLSLQNILKKNNVNYKDFNYLILGGVSKLGSIEYRLKEKKYKNIIIAVDNDIAGFHCIQKIQNILISNEYEGSVSLCIPNQKDFNEDIVNNNFSFKSISSGKLRNKTYQAFNQIISDNKYFNRYIENCANNYGYNTNIQMLILEQNFNTSFIANNNIWDKLNRTIKEQAKPIFNIKKGKYIDILFDISDTVLKTNKEDIFKNNIEIIPKESKDEFFIYLKELVGDEQSKTLPEMIAKIVDINFMLNYPTNIKDTNILNNIKEISSAAINKRLGSANFVNTDIEVFKHVNNQLAWEILQSINKNIKFNLQFYKKNFEIFKGKRREYNVKRQISKTNEIGQSNGRNELEPIRKESIKNNDARRRNLVLSLNQARFGRIINEPRLRSIELLQGLSTSENQRKTKRIRKGNQNRRYVIVQEHSRYNKIGSRSRNEQGGSKSVSKGNESNLEQTSLFNSANKEDKYNVPNNEKIQSKSKKDTRIEDNIKAINLIKHGTYNNTEKTVLENYHGWGGLSEVFEKENKYNNLIRNLLSEKEYKQARSSTLTAFYTSDKIVNPLLDHIFSKINFENNKNINILDPSMGIGNFFHYLKDKDSIKENCKLYGVEIDDISYQIANYLYPNAQIMHSGFEDIEFKDNSFDLIMSNIPFGDISIYDKKYKKSYLIHDYFIKKSIDIVKPNGIVAFITSAGTLDKKNNEFRKEIYRKAELKGAIRLNNKAFKEEGTSIVSDILVFQKREQEITEEEINYPSWIFSEEYQHTGILLNKYFIENPHMILGYISESTAQFGRKILDVTYEKKLDDLSVDIANTIETIDIDNYNVENQEDYIIENLDNHLKELDENNIYVYQNNELFYIENNNKIIPKISKKQKDVIIKLLELKQSIYNIMDIQSKEYSKEDFYKLLEKLNNQYDKFVLKYGYVTPNIKYIEEDVTSSIFYSLEVSHIDDAENIVYEKSDLFFEPTISDQTLNINNIQDALAVCLSDKGEVDIEYISEIYNKETEVVLKELDDYVVIDHNSLFNVDNQYNYILKTEYLSGDVKTKKEELEYLLIQDINDEFKKIIEKNLSLVNEVIPKDIPFSDIGFNLGTTWIDTEIYNQFMQEVLKVRSYANSLVFDYMTNTYNISNKSHFYRQEINNEFGTSRINPLHILERTMNMIDVKIYDNIDDKRILNKKETTLARLKQDKIKNAFNEWVSSNVEVSTRIEKLYNEKMNRYVHRSFDEKLFVAPKNITNKIELTKEQKKGVVRVLLGGNTLLPYKVGHGKTFTMIASAMTLKQAGICKKPLFIVPNHLVGQWANEFYMLNPNAKILVPTKKDLTAKHRKSFLSKIMGSSFDAVIMPYTQFEKIKMSNEYVLSFYSKEIERYEQFISEYKYDNERNFSIKQCEKQLKQLREKYKKTQTQIDERKDDNVLSFEDLGIDYLFVDEAHYYKNCPFTTRLKNISGINPTGSLKSMDFMMKTQYITSLHNQKRGLVFATATPISNSISELFIMQKYLQNDILEKLHIDNFDSWVSTYAQIETKIELNVSAQNYKTRTRFTGFRNLPELISIFNLVADYQEDIPEIQGIPNLKTGKIQTIAVESSPLAKKIMQEFDKRNSFIEAGVVDSKEDNMLKLTNDGRKLSIDVSLLNTDFTQERQFSKVYVACDYIYKEYINSEEYKGFQMVFLDYGVALYDKIKEELVRLGIQENEIAFISDAKTDKAKIELFQKCRNGDVRVLLGSTEKMGQGTNVQKRMISLHHIDCPWRPSDIEQRNGRILRRGNMFKEVNVYRYVTKGTFDSYMWQTQENKLLFINPIGIVKGNVRFVQDVDEMVLDCAEVKAICCSNPIIKEKLEIDNKIKTLKLEKSEFLKSQENARHLIKNIPKEIKLNSSTLEKYKLDIDFVKNYNEKNYNEKTDNIQFNMEINGVNFTERKKAIEHLNNVIKNININADNYGKNIKIGNLKGFDLYINIKSDVKKIILQNNIMKSIEYKDNSDYGFIIKLENLINIDKLILSKRSLEESINELNNSLEYQNKIINSEFPKKQELADLTERQGQIQFQLEMGEQEQDITYEEI